MFKNVHFAYPTRAEKPILRGLSLHIEAGKTVALVGPSGGGKSTVMAMLQRLYDPTSGSVELDGQPLAGAEALIPLVDDGEAHRVRILLGEHR